MLDRLYGNDDGTVATKICGFLAKKAWHILIVFTISLVFLLLQYRYPYYFYEDDNRSFFLPMYVHNYRSIINGEFPLFNFHQFLGIPILGNGQSGAFYPLTYISLFLSKIILGNYFATIDIYVYIHLIIAGVGFFILLKSLELSDKGAFFGALTWPLTSFIVYTSNSWAFISAFAALFPLAVYFGIRLYRNLNIRNFISLVICQALLFYIGSPQYFIYSMIFQVATLLLLMFIEIEPRENRARFLKISGTFLLGYICTFILCLPLLLPTWYQMTVSFSRNFKLTYEWFVRISYDTKLLVNSLITPFNLIENNFMHLDNLAYVGYYTLLFAIITLYIAIRKGTSHRKRLFIYAFCLLCFISYLWALGLIIPEIIYLIPILNRLCDTAKIVFFANFFIVIIASIGVDTFFNYVTPKVNSLLFMFIIILHVVSFVGLYLIIPQQTFGLYQERIPIQDTLDNLFDNNRIVTLHHNVDTQLSDAFIYANQATLRGKYHFAGYTDPLLPQQNKNAVPNINYAGVYYNNDVIPIDYFRKWAVKWYIAGAKGIPSELVGDLLLKHQDDRRTIYYDAEARPMICWQQGFETEGINYEIKTNCIKIDTMRNTGGNLKVNFLYHPFFKAFIDGKQVDITKTEDGDMVVYVPEGQRSVLVKYYDPYFLTGCYIVSVFLLGAIIYAILTWHKKYVHKLS